MKRSRLTKKFKRQSQKTLILSFLGILVILIAILKLGVPFIVAVGNIFEHASSTKITTSNTNNNFIATPSIDDLPNATGKQDLKITGISSPNTTVELFVDGEKSNNAQAASDGTFEFNLKLSVGSNIIKVRAMKNNVESDFSDSQTVIYANTPPNLIVDFPSDGSNVSSDSVNVTGKTDEGAKVTVNDFWAVIGPDNTFSYNLHLNPGGNQIKVISIDDAGNKTEKDLNVNYSQ